MKRFQFKHRKSNKTLPVAKWYGDLLFSWITKGQAEEPIPLNNVSIQLGYNKITSQDYKTWLIQVQSFNEETVPNLLALLRSQIKFKYGNDVCLDELSRSKPHHVQWKKTSMVNNVASWRNSKKKAQERKDSADEEGYSSSLDDSIINWENRRQGSWNYFKYCEANNIELSLTAFVYRLRIPKEKEIYLDVLFEDLENIFLDSGIHARIVNIYVYDAIDEMSPFKHEGTKLASTLIADRVLSTEITSKLTPLTQGKLNKGNLILGNDIFNGLPVYMNTHPKDGSCTNALYLASAGGGKSTLTKSIEEQVLAERDFSYIIDYEGNEYSPWGKAYGSTFLDFTGSDGKYYEPLRLATLTGIPEIDNKIVPNALGYTETITSILLKKPLTSSQSKLLYEVVGLYADSKGVDFKNKSTWKYSDAMALRGLEKRFRDMRASRTMRETYDNDLTELADTYENNFTGVRDILFLNPISFDELAKEQSLIIRFGSDSNADLTGEDPIDTQIKQLTVVSLLQELARYRRLHDQSFTMLLEELNRYLKHKGSLSWTSAMYLAVRKCNGSMHGVINDPEKLNSSVSALINNSEYVIVGKNNDINALDYMFQTSKLRGMKPLVESLNNYPHSFLVSDSKGLCSIFRAELPKAYINSPIYKTRSDS